jgi:hypothetical protein
LLYIISFGKSNFVIVKVLIGFGFDSINHNVDLIVLKSVAIECSVASIIDKLLCISNFETRSMLRSELVMIHMMGKRWLSFTVLFEYNFDQPGYGLDYV